MKLQCFSHFLRRNRLCLLVPLCQLAVMAVIVMFSGQWPWRVNNYNSYTLQALAWLDGRLDLADGEKYRWLELAIYEGRYYVSFPPFPSYVLLPFAAALGKQTPDAWIALFFAVLSGVYAARLYREVTGSEKGLVPLTLYLLIGNGYAFLTVNGWVWFLAQNMCFALSLMALYYAWRGRGGPALAFWACAVGCRPLVIVYLPLLAYLLCRGRGRFWKLARRRWYWAVAPLALAASYMALNSLRFGNPLEFGHNYLPEFSREGAAAQFDWAHLGKNLLEYLRLPKDNGDSGLGFYALNGNAVYLLNPIFLTGLGTWIAAAVRALVERTGKPRLLWLPLLIAAHIVWVCCHSTLGGVQFGNRYLVDTLPYLFLGILVWMRDGERLALWTMPLLCYGTAIHVAGAIFSYRKLL